MFMLYENIMQWTDAEPHAVLYIGKEGLEQFKRDTFSPLTQFEGVLFEVRGDSYRERKESVRDIAIEFSNIANCGGLTWSDLNILSDWFYRYGKRYGLLTEFRENGLC